MANVYDFLPMNWRGAAVALETSWLTDVVLTNSRLAEERRSLTGSPRREIGVSWTGLTQEDSTRLLFLLMRAGNQRLRLPIYPDVTHTDAVTGASTVPCDTTHRRFYVGKRIALANSSQIEYGVILSLTATEITLTAPLSAAFPKDSRVYPVLEVEIAEQASSQAITDELFAVTAEFSEVLPSLPASLDYAGLAGEGFQQIEGKAFLLDLGPDWTGSVALTMNRVSQSLTSGRDRGIAVYGPRAQVTLRANFNSLSRDDFFRLLQFFDAHRGRAIPFWVACPLDMWKVSAISGFDIDVSHYGDLDDYLTFVQSIEGGSPYLLLELADGTTELRQVTSSAEFPGLFRMTTSATMAGITPSEVVKASLAFYMRFEKDAMPEEWVTNTVALVSLSMVEVMRWESSANVLLDDALNPLPMDGYFAGNTGDLCG